MFRIVRTVCVSICLAGLLCAPVHSAGLRYRVQGANKEATENIRAYLGEAPQEAAAIERFLSSAPQLTAQALEALGFYNHQLDLQVNREVNPWVATFAVTVGEPLRYTAVAVSLAGQAQDDPAFTAVLTSRAPKPADVVHHGRYEQLKSELVLLARRSGYFDARFTTSRVDLDVGRRQASLTLVFDAGRRYQFGAITIDETLIDPGLLERLQPFEPGADYEQQLLLDLRQRLLRLGYFGSVTVLPDIPGRAFPAVPIRVAVTAAPRHSFELGVGFSTDTRQRLSMIWQSPRLNRWGHSQETALRWSPINPQARVTYSIPLADAANDVLQLSARLENNEFGDLESEQRELRVRRERTTPTQVWGVQMRGLDEQWGVFGNDFDARFLLAGASVSSRYRRGNAVDPSRGVSQFYSLEGASASVGSDDDLLRAYASVTGLHTLGEHWRVVARAEGGMLWTGSDQADELPPSLAFFAGGDSSIRGFAYQSLGREVGLEGFAEVGQRERLVVGGTRLLTGSLEIQRYITPQWRGALFVDAGDAFDSGDFNANVGIGFGVHYLSPVGALRLELANPVSESGGSWRVHINIGAEF